MAKLIPALVLINGTVTLSVNSILCNLISPEESLLIIALIGAETSEYDAISCQWSAREKLVDEPSLLVEEPDKLIAVAVTTA